MNDAPDRPTPAASGHLRIADDPRAGEIIDILAKEAAIDRALLRPEATIEALGIASLDIVQSIFALETHFDIEIPVVSDRVGAEFTTIGDLVGHVLDSLDRARAAARAGAG